MLQFEECLKRELGLVQKDQAAFIKEFSESDYNAIEAGWKVSRFIWFAPLGGAGPAMSISGVFCAVAALNITLKALIQVPLTAVSCKGRSIAGVGDERLMCNTWQQQCSSPLRLSMLFPAFCGKVAVRCLSSTALDSTLNPCQRDRAFVGASAAAVQILLWHPQRACLCLEDFY